MSGNKILCQNFICILPGIGQLRKLQQEILRNSKNVDLDDVNNAEGIMMEETMLK